MKEEIKTKKKKNKKNEIITKEKKVEVKNNNKHNGIISFWKFWFCLMVVIYHANVFVNGNEKELLSKGSIAVEFFFLVSGFLMAKKALNIKDEDNSNLGKETLNYIYGKFKAFFPYVLTAGIMGLIFINIYKDTKIFDNISSIWDILLLRMSGLVGLSVNGPVWYISAMLLCMLILYPLLRKYKYNFVYLAVPLIVLLGFGYLNQEYGSLRMPDLWIGYTYKGVIRAFIELSLGSILYVVCEKIKKINFTKLGSYVITLIEIICFLTPFIMSQFVDRATKYDYIVVAILSVGIILAFSGKTKESKLFNNKFFYWLEKLSLPIYMFHFSIRLFVRYSAIFSNYNYYQKLSVYLVLTFIISIILMYLIRYFQKNNNIFKKIKSWFIIENKQEKTTK